MLRVCTEHLIRFHAILFDTRSLMIRCELKHTGILKYYDITRISKEDQCVFCWLVECCELDTDSVRNEQNMNVTEGNIKGQIR
jgi:hypothetical protein